MPVFQFTFPFAFVGLGVDIIGSVPLGDRRWLLMWKARPEIVAPYAFIVSVNGKHQETVYNDEQTVVEADNLETDVAHVIQVPAAVLDGGHFPDFLFNIAVLNNKGIITITPPGDVSKVDAYRVYFDNGTGTVTFDDAGLLGEVKETGAPSYQFATRELAAATYKSVVRTVTKNGTESTNVAPERSFTVQAYIPPVTGFGNTYDEPTKKATLSWVFPAGATQVQIFYNGGSEADQFPDYDTVLATVNFPTTTFLTAALAAGAHVWGIRATDGSNFELNTSVRTKLRTDAAFAEISGPPPKPRLIAVREVAGKITLKAFVDTTEDQNPPIPDTVQFYTDDGAGGPVDFTTPLPGGPFTLVAGSVYLEAVTVTAAFGATARKFAAVAFKGSVPSEQGDAVTITPNVDVPPAPVYAAAAGRA